MSVRSQVRASANVIRTPYGSAREQAHRHVLLLQAITVAWMLIECSVALLASRKANSAALLAFGSDSLVELLSACIVLLQFIPSILFDEKKADRLAASLLYVLAFIVAGSAAVALAFRIHPDTSVSGIGITAAALIVMPILGVMKRKTFRELGSNALAADAMQSTTCAYLAAIALTGLVVDAAFRIWWIDSVAALLIVPFLVVEGRKAWSGEHCCSTSCRV